MKNYIVTFSETGARVTRVDDPSAYHGAQFIRVNPKVPWGVPPHYWKIADDGLIAPMDEFERQARDDQHAELFPAPALATSRFWTKFWFTTSAILLLSVIGFTLHHFRFF